VLLLLFDQELTLCSWPVLKQQVVCQLVCTEPATTKHPDLESQQHWTQQNPPAQPRAVCAPDENKFAFETRFWKLRQPWQHQGASYHNQLTHGKIVDPPELLFDAVASR
jgi:hypothetical protein